MFDLPHRDYSGAIPRESLMCRSLAVKQVEYRRRRDAGRIYREIEIDEVATTESMIAHGRVRRVDQDDPVALRKALAAAAAKLIELSLNLCGHHTIQCY